MNTIINMLAIIGIIQIVGLLILLAWAYFNFKEIGLDEDDPFE